MAGERRHRNQVTAPPQPLPAMPRSSALAEIDGLARSLGGRLFFGGLCATALFCLALFALRADKIFTLPSSPAAASSEDLLAFDRAGRLALEGRAAAAYDLEAFREELPPVGQGLRFLNPPHALLLFAPISASDYAAAKVFFLVASAASLAGLAVLIFPAFPQRAAGATLLLLSPGAFATGLVLQVGALIAIALAAALLLAGKRPFTSGLLLGLMTMKPQFGFIAPIVLAARGDWRTFAIAALATGGLVAASIGVFGIEPWRAFFATAAASYGAHANSVHIDMPSFQQAAMRLGAGPVAAGVVQGFAVAAALATGWVAARRFDRNTATGFILILSAAASPSLWVYDWPLISAGLLVLISQRTPLSIPSQIGALLLWIAPLVTLGIATPESTLFAPIACVIAISALWREFQSSAADKGRSL